MFRRLLYPPLSLLLLFLAGCLPGAARPAPALPQPQVWVTHAVTPAVVPLLPATASMPSPSPAPTLASSLQEIAFQTYGDRLIQQIDIPAIGVKSNVLTVGWRVDLGANTSGGASAEWDSPGAAVGWVLTGALPDQAGNVILYGHNNVYGSIFKNLGELKTGDEITLTTGLRAWQYHVDQALLLPILGADEEARRAYLTYLAPTDKARLTLISCWPPESNTHRVVVIAFPSR